MNNKHSTLEDSPLAIKVTSPEVADAFIKIEPRQQAIEEALSFVGTSSSVSLLRRFARFLRHMQASLIDTPASVPGQFIKRAPPPPDPADLAQRALVQTAMVRAFQTMK
jgi:hypothetical protein